MKPRPANIHATAIVVGTRGILLTGASGSGKSMLAFACIAAAKRQGAFAALVADDRVLVSRYGDHLVATRPETIAGLIELRGSGIARVESLPAAALDVAIKVVPLSESDRLPPENEHLTISGLGELPLVRIWQGAPDPLAVLAAFSPGLHSEMPF
ncbi:serine kinase of HPr protein (carbohydrate metabolism regulator) [Rhizobium petrolearium]|uniref:HPr kinase/phosphorylase n=1 Tax=Neorhizobium petrolearium TaxID=515361 RepID=UPI001AE241FD|nr:HPr kinase/phosphorylase [Neorhizobium petrolearium]MBP1847206.1 serine kinase of HPr protein (carbohydrate metabolism regulator) [Neorhizobium petrolearium]